MVRLDQDLARKAALPFAGVGGDLDTESPTPGCASGEVWKDNMATRVTEG
jgi:hypothetical protein